MQLTHAMDRYRYARYLIFKWRDELSLLHRLGLAFAFSCLTGLAAQIRIPLSFTPVPITAQVLVVLLSGIILGGYYGGLSQIFYVGLGTVGIPWFSGWNGGLAAITGVTGGYIIGFVPAALIIGWLTDRYTAVRRFHIVFLYLFQLLLMTVAMSIIYIFGATQLAIVMNTGFLKTMRLAVFPFILVDLAKAVVAAGVSTSILPKE
jgi:biotin transport system substrate-specific component